MDVLGRRSADRPSGAVLVRALRDRELRRAAARLAADAVVLARTVEEASARAGQKRRKGRRKLVVLVAGAGAIGLALGARKALRRG